MKKLGEGGLMALSWSEQAEDDLEIINPAVRDQLRRNATETLPDVRDCTGRTLVGDKEIMWHRGITHVQEEDEDDDEDDGDQPCDYYLLYRRLDSEDFVVLAVRSVHQIGRKWMQMNNREPHGDLSGPEWTRPYQQRTDYHR
jgi:hypothetical protein